MEGVYGAGNGAEGVRRADGGRRHGRGVIRFSVLFSSFRCLSTSFLSFCRAASLRTAGFFPS